MVTREQVLAAPYHQIYHAEFNGNHCSCLVGPRGAIHLHFVAVRCNGSVRTWKTRPEEFRLPIKHGMRGYAYIDQDNASHFHREEDCRALQQAQQLRKEALHVRS